MAHHVPAVWTAVAEEAQVIAARPVGTFGLAAADSPTRNTWKGALGAGYRGMK